MINERARADLHMLYEVSAQDLAFFKQQQWRVTNYAALIYAALFSIANITKNPGDGEKLLLTVIAAITALSGCVLIGQLAYAICVRRERLKTIRPKLSKEFNLCWAAKPKTVDDKFVPYFLHGVLVIGAILTGYLIWTIPSLGGAV